MCIGGEEAPTSFTPSHENPLYDAVFEFHRLHGLYQLPLDVVGPELTQNNADGP